MLKKATFGTICLLTTGILLNYNACDGMSIKNSKIARNKGNLP
ncbi:MAG: hypothetical protein RSB09_01225 [Clostridia bacterium]